MNDFLKKKEKEEADGWHIFHQLGEKIKPQPVVCISSCDRLVDNSFLLKNEQRKRVVEGGVAADDSVRRRNLHKQKARQPRDFTLRFYSHRLRFISPICLHTVVYVCGNSRRRRRSCTCVCVPTIYVSMQFPCMSSAL